jgi:hypothetical protein
MGTKSGQASIKAIVIRTGGPKGRGIHGNVQMNIYRKLQLRISDFGFISDFGDSGFGILIDSTL